jgi:SEC-C motif-containing protein
MNCYCFSGKNYRDCCQPYIEETKQADNAEQLMRSRYTAYKLNKGAYILATYASEAQQQHSLEDIQQWAEQCQWLKLEVISQDLNDAQQQFVEFKAYYIYQQQLMLLHELSRFCRENNQWRYLDGEIKADKLLEKLSRNQACPCGSKLKYKRCCMR